MQGTPGPQDGPNKRTHSNSGSCHGSGTIRTVSINNLFISSVPVLFFLTLSIKKGEEDVTFCHTRVIEPMSHFNWLSGLPTKKGEGVSGPVFTRSESSVKDN